MSFELDDIRDNYKSSASLNKFNSAKFRCLEKSASIRHEKLKDTIKKFKKVDLGQMDEKYNILITVFGKCDGLVFSTKDPKCSLNKKKLRQIEDDLRRKLISTTGVQDFMNIRKSRNNKQESRKKYPNELNYSLFLSQSYCVPIDVYQRSFRAIRRRNHKIEAAAEPYSW
jgi:hypothetical protein